MKTKFTLLVLLFAGVFSVNAQQIPNESFDNWASPLAPDNWTSFDALFQAPLGLTSRDTIDKIVGPSSLKVKADSIPGQPNLGVLSGVTSLGTSYLAGQIPTFVGIPFAFRPDTFYFGYKYVPAGLDTAGISLGLRKSGSYLLVNAAGPATIPLTAQAQWSLGYLPLGSYYLNANTPDTLELQLFASIANVSKKGSALNVDALLFGYVNLPNALQEVADRLNITVYPNPATDAITISTDENVEGFKVVVSDLNGRVVLGSSLSGQSTTVNVSELANGTYIYRVADKTGNILRSDRFNIAK